MGLKYNDNGTLKDLKIIVEKNDTYLTTEQQIGTWIDGKPIYRKVYEVSSISIGDNLNVASAPSNMKRCIKLYGSAQSGNSTYPMPSALATSSGDYSIAPYIYNSNKIAVWVGAGRGTISNAIIIIEYTKTTD